MKKALFVLLTAIFLISFVSAEREVENDKWRLVCNRDTYHVLQGSFYAYCNVTNKEMGRLTTNIYTTLEQSLNVHVQQIELWDDYQWEVLGSQPHTDVRGFIGKKTESKVQISGESTVQFRFLFNVETGTVKDEFWFSVDDFQLDPAITGCAEYDDLIACNHSTFVGNSITTSKNILIWNATLDGSTGSLINLTTTGWLQINESTIIGAGGAGEQGDILLTAGGNIYINDSTLNAWGVAPASGSGSSSLCKFASLDGDVRILNSTLNCYGSNCNPPAGNACSGGTAILIINGTNIVVNDTNLNIYGGNGATSDSGFTGNGGSTNILWYALSDIIGAATKPITWNFQMGDGAKGGSGPQCGDSTNVYFESNKLKLFGYNQTVLTLDMDEGAGSGGCDPDDATKVSFNVHDEVRFDDNVTLSVSGSETATNHSDINFTANSNLRLFFSGVSIPYSKFFVLCPNQAIGSTVSTVWENYLGKTQLIDFAYCSNTNITRAQYELLDNTPTPPAFIPATPDDNAELLYPIQSFNFSANNDALHFFLYLGANSNLSDSDIVVNNQTATSGSYYSYSANFSALGNGTYYYKARVQNITTGLFSEYTSTRSLRFYNGSLLTNCTEGLKLITFYGKHGDSDIELTLDISFDYRYANYSGSTSAFKLRDRNNYSLCGVVNTTYFLTGHLEFGDGTTYDKSSYYLNDLEIDGNSIYTLNLYHVLPNSSTLVTFTVTDENDDAVEGAYVYINEYDVGSNSYKTIEVIRTDNNGEAFGNLILYTVWYQFKVIYDGEIKLIEPNKKVSDTEVSLRIELVETPTFIAGELQDLDIILTANRDLYSFDLNWTDVDSTISKLIFYVNKVNTTTDILIYNFNSTNTSGSLTYTLTAPYTTTYGTYIGSVYGVSLADGATYYLKAATITLKEEYDLFGKEALFISFIFIGTMSMIGIAVSAVASIILTVLGMIIFFALGFYMVSLSGLISIIVGMILIMVKVNRR